MTDLSCESEQFFCEKPLFCEKCLKEFTFASNLRKHYPRCLESEIRKKSLNIYDQICELWIREKPSKLSFPKTIFIGDRLLCIFKWIRSDSKYIMQV